MTIFRMLLLLSCLLPALLPAQDEAGKRGVDPRFESFSAAYGRLLNIEETLKAIESQHPALRERVKKIRREFAASAVGKGCTALVGELKEMMGDEFAGFETASRKQIRDLGAAQKVDQAMAEMALENIDRIKAGNLPREILRTVIALNPDYRKNPLKEFQDGWVAGYSSKMDPEKRKVHFLLRYPGSWKPVATSAKRDLFTADSEDGFGRARLALRVIPAPDPKYAKMKPLELGKLLVPATGKVVASAPASVAGLPAARLVYDLPVEGGDLEMRLISYTVHTRENFVMLVATLDPRGGDDPAAETKRLMPLLDVIAAKLEME